MQNTNFQEISTKPIKNALLVTVGPVFDLNDCVVCSSLTEYGKVVSDHASGMTADAAPQVSLRPEPQPLDVARGDAIIRRPA